MDGKQFDTLARAVTREASRRRLFGALAGAAMGLATGANALAAKKRKKKRGNAAPDEDPVIPGTQVGGVWDETIEICHFNFEDGSHRVMMVSAPSLPDYLALGDTLFIDCCVDVDCGPLPCTTAPSCIEGACMYEFTGGAPCDLGNGYSGVCDKGGTCVGSVTTDPAPLVTQDAAPVG